MIKNDLIAKVITNLFLIGFLGYISGKFVYKFTNNDNLWLGYNYYFFASIFVLVTLLVFNNYLWFTVMSIVLILGSVLFLYFKANPVNLIESANNIEANNGSIPGALKQNPLNFSLFFWVMFTATSITVIGIIIASKAYKKMKLKEGKLGDRGEDGPRGHQGAISPILNSPGEICYQQLLAHCEKILEEIKLERNIPFSDGEIHLKNFNFKEHLKRISYSEELKTEIMKLLRCKLRCKSREVIKREYCRSKDRFLAFIISKIKQDVTAWVRRMCMYKKGLVYLSQEMKIPRDWEVLYLKVDKEIGLRPDPHSHFTYLSFNWGCDTQSNYTDCCPRPTTSASLSDPPRNNSGNSSESQDNHDEFNNYFNDYDDKNRYCNVTEKEIREIINDAFTPEEDKENNLNRENRDGNYTWNWGDV